MSGSRHNNSRGDNAVDRKRQDASPLAANTLAARWRRMWRADCRKDFRAEQRAANGLAQLQTETLSEKGLSGILSALGLPDLPRLASEDRARIRAALRQLLLLIGLILFVTTLTQPDVIAPLAVEHLWFGNGNANALQTALLWLALSGFWFVKPLWALLIGRVSTPAASRRNWLMGSAFGAAGLWLLAGLTHSPLMFALLLISVGAMLALASTVMGGILVEQGQQMGATGRLGAFHAGGIFLARLTGAGAASLLGSQTLHFTAPLCALILAVFAVLCGALLQGKRKKEKGKSVGALLAAPSFNPPFYAALTLDGQSPIENRTSPIVNRNMMGVMAIAALVYMAPNFSALQDQENLRLHFGEGVKYGLAFVGGACGLVGVGGYLYLCRRVTLQTLLTAGIACNALGTLLYLGYRSPLTAVCIEGANGLLSALVFAMLFDLAIRAIPRGQAMMGYALLTSVFMLASRLSNVFGSWLNVSLHWHFAQVVGLSAGLSVPALAIMAYLPASLLDRREGKIVTEAIGETLPGIGIPSYGH